MPKVKLTKTEKQDGRLIKKEAKRRKLAERNEIKTQRRAWIFGTVAAIGLMAILDKRRK